MATIFSSSSGFNAKAGDMSSSEVGKYLGTTYMLSHKKDFEPGRSSDFIFKVKFKRDLYDMNGNKVADKDEASEVLALSLRDFAGPSMTVDPITLRTGNGEMKYAGVPTVGTSAISFTDYIGMDTEQILLAWYVQCHNPKNDKIGFKEYYSNDGLLYKWAPNGTRVIDWLLQGCWINEYNQGNYSRQNPEFRQFSTTIQYDKAYPYTVTDYSAMRVSDSDVNNQNNASTKSFHNHTATNYLGTLSDPESASTSNAGSKTSFNYNA